MMSVKIELYNVLLYQERKAYIYIYTYPMHGLLRAFPTSNNPLNDLSYSEYGVSLERVV